MHRHFALVAALAAGLLGPPAFAQPKGVIAPIGTSFTYQGELKFAGQPATGLFDFEVCLFSSSDPGDTTALFCNLLNDQPVDAAGRFTVNLNFGPQFDGSARFVELRVRPGADGGAYTTLQPRQAIRAVPEAMRAANTPWLGVTGVPPSLADNLDNVGITSLSAGPGLTTNRSVPGAGAPITSDTGSGVLSIRDGGIDAAMIVPGAIGAAQIDTSQVQTRITGSCGEGEFFRGINADGSLDCELLPVSFSRVLDSVGDIGTHVAIALRGDRRPVVAYHDVTNGNLKLYDCADPTCASGTRRILDSPGDVGESVSIAVRPSELPVIAYRDVTSQALKLYDCSNIACTSGTARTLDTAVNVGTSIAMALRADGRAFIAYEDNTNFQMRVYDCSNLGCSSGTVRPQPGTDRPYGLSIALRADGRPLIALGGSAGPGSRIRTFDCVDAACTSGTLRNLTTLSYAGPPAMVVRGNGRPLVVTTGIAASLVVHDCADAACVTSSGTSYTYATSAAVAAVLRPSGNLLIAHGDFVTDVGYQLNVFDCGNAGCTDGSSRVLGGNGANGSWIGMAVRDDGRPVLASYDGDNDDLRLQICANPDCS
jgi:hypothetical protein